MKTLLITHTDLDGISPIILLNLTGIDFTYKSIDIYEIDSEFNLLFENNFQDLYDLVYICDLTIPEHIYAKLDELKVNYKVFDHHETHMYASSKKNVTIKIKDGKTPTCATEIFYKYLVKKYKELDKPNIKDYVTLVRELDTFTFTSDKGRDLEAIRSFLGRTNFINSITRRLKHEKNYFEFTAFEKRYSKLKKEEIERYLEAKEKTMLKYKIQNKICGVIIAESNKSELGNYISKNHPELDLVILINASKQISYRTCRDDIHVNEFASIYGGGGHSKASGSIFSIEAQKKIIEDYFNGAIELVDEN